MLLLFAISYSYSCSQHTERFGLVGIVVLPLPRLLLLLLYLSLMMRRMHERVTSFAILVIDRSIRC